MSQICFSQPLREGEIWRGTTEARKDKREGQMPAPPAAPDSFGVPENKPLRGGPTLLAKPHALGQERARRRHLLGRGCSRVERASLGGGNRPWKKAVSESNSLDGFMMTNVMATCPGYARNDDKILFTQTYPSRLVFAAWGRWVSDPFRHIRFLHTRKNRQRAPKGGTRGPLNLSIDRKIGPIGGTRARGFLPNGGDDPHRTHGDAEYPPCALPL